jgi:hypothetical protein
LLLRSQGRHTEAVSALMQARVHYERWGATAKVLELEAILGGPRP